MDASVLPRCLGLVIASRREGEWLWLHIRLDSHTHYWRGVRWPALPAAQVLGRRCALVPYGCGVELLTREMEEGGGAHATP